MFSEEDQKELEQYLDHLQSICCLPAEQIKPSFSCKKLGKKSQWDDTLKWGVVGFQDPSDLRYLWQPKSELKEHDVDFIMVQGQKWFFNIYDKTGRFLLEDGSRKVEIEFPYWMEMGKVMKTRGIRAAVFQALNQCMGEKFPDHKNLQDCFSDELCHRIYRNNPSREAIEIAVLEMIEKLRKKTAAHLEKNHSKDVASEPVFKKFVKSCPDAEKKTERQKIHEFLSGQKRAYSLYRLAEKYGVIKNARRIFQYEDIRNHQRHPNVIKEHKLDPDQIYKDFCLALNVPQKPAGSYEESSRFGDNIAVALHLGALSYIWNILDKHTNPNLKKKKKVQSLIENGILTAEEASLLNELHRKCDDVAHVNDTTDESRQTVATDRKLFNLAYILSERDRLIRNP